ncbi:MAG: helix-turn-helix domain-containing protein [Pseudomonadota bacterium]
MLNLDLIVGANAAAAYTGLKPCQIYRMAKSGLIPTIRVGHRMLFRKSELDAFFRSASSRANAEFL